MAKWKSPKINVPFLNPHQFTTEDEYVDASLLQRASHMMKDPNYIPRSARREEVYARQIYRNKGNFNPN